MDVSIIIVSYNTCDILSACLNSIKEQTKEISYEVIVVDNDSKDNTKLMIENNYQWVKIIKSSVNLGFGRANNLGVSYARGKYLFFLNSDTVLINNAVYYFFEFAEKHHKPFGALGCILTGVNGLPCHSYGKFITPKNELKESIAKYLRFLKDKSLLHPNKITSPLDVDYITGADLFVPKKVFEDIGGFDPLFFMYCEEVDWQKRMDDKNLKRLIIPGPEIVHLEGGSDLSKSSIWSKSRRNNFHKSKKIYYVKHFNHKIMPFFKTCKFLLDLPIIALLKIYDKFNHRP